MARPLEEYPSFEKLREYSRALELAAGFIEENTPQRIRVAFLLLQIASRLLTHRLLQIQLLIEPFGPETNSGFRDLALSTMHEIKIYQPDLCR